MLPIHSGYLIRMLALGKSRFSCARSAVSRNSTIYNRGRASLEEVGRPPVTILLVLTDSLRL